MTLTELADRFNEQWAAQKNEFAQQEIRQDQAAEEAKMVAETRERRIDEGDYSAEDEAPRPGRLTNATMALRFMMAGNAYFTLRSLRTGTRFTYRVAMPKKARAEPNPWYYVSLLNGPDNTANYTWMGTILSNGSFKLAPRGLVGSEAPSMKGFLWLLERLRAGRLPETTELWHEGRCGRCGRLLTVPESIAAGIGPECAGRMK